jgi:4-carboxymuconolactone decarboxylase
MKTGMMEGKVAMQRIAYPVADNLPADLREKLEGAASNVQRMLLSPSPDVARGYAAFGRALISHSKLDARLREIAILRVGYLSDCRYEVFQHEALSRHIGMGDADFAAIRAGGERAAALGEQAAAVVAFTDDLVRNVRPGDATLNAVRAFLDDQRVIDLTLVVGSYMMVCRFLETTGIPIDEAPIAWGGMGVERAEASS